MQNFNTQRCTNMNILLNNSALLQAEVHFSMCLNRYKAANDNTGLNIIHYKKSVPWNNRAVARHWNHISHTHQDYRLSVVHLKGDSKKKTLFNQIWAILFQTINSFKSWIPWTEQKILKSQLRLMERHIWVLACIFVYLSDDSSV